MMIRNVYKIVAVISFAMFLVAVSASAQDDADYSQYQAPMDPAPTDSGYTTNYEDPSGQVQPMAPQEYAPPAETTEPID